MELSVVIMAAGRGTRMRSTLPKVLHHLDGKPMIQHVIETAAKLIPNRIIVVTGYEARLVETEVTEAFMRGDQDDMPHQAPLFVHQEPQRGTGHAVLQAVPELPDDGLTLILNGDVPLVSHETLKRLIYAVQGKHLALLTDKVIDPTGYGRIIRSPISSSIVGIVEQKDATPDQLEIHEVYTGILVATTTYLKRWLSHLTPDNAQREYYLTDIVAMAARVDKVLVGSAQPDSPLEVMGVNSLSQLIALEREVQEQKAEALLDSGVRVMDPRRLDIRGTLTCGVNVEIDVNCVFEGHVELGDGVRIGANCIIKDTKVYERAIIQPFCHIVGAVVGESAQVGPFARLRGGADLGENVHIGNFVEVKNSTVCAGAKANHLAYIGDAEVGERVNFGAGAITANYDGANKHKTRIGDDAHIGSNSVLVAPCTVPNGATVGAGSTLMGQVGDGLSFTRGEVVNKPRWRRPVKAAAYRPPQPGPTILI